MTVKELQEILCEYTDNIEVDIAVNFLISPIIHYDYCTEMETNQVKLVLYGRDRNYYEEKML